MRLPAWFLGLCVACASCAPSTGRAPAQVAHPSAEVPALDGLWVKLVGPPDLGGWNRPEAQPVDFTIWRAKDGTWQLVSCVRRTSFPGGGRLFYRWEAPKITGPYQPAGIFLTSRDRPGLEEGALQAPHVLSVDGTFYMLFNSGGAAHMLASEDGKSFRPADPREGGTPLFAMGRDVMILDGRSRDGLFRAYYTAIVPPLYPDRQHHTVAMRTARDLRGPWSDAVDLGVSTRTTPGDRFGFIDAESPFVLARGKHFYRWEQMDVYVSDRPDAWSGPPIARLTGDDPRTFYAPEVVEDEAGRTYVAGYKYKGERDGIYMAPLAWRR